MTPALLAEIGEALYGPQWQAALARRRGVGDRAVRRWLAGDRAIPADMPDWLVAEIDANTAALARLRARLAPGRSRAA